MHHRQPLNFLRSPLTLVKNRISKLPCGKKLIIRRFRMSLGLRHWNCNHSNVSMNCFLVSLFLVFVFGTVHGTPLKYCELIDFILSDWEGSKIQYPNISNAIMASSYASISISMNNILITLPNTVNCSTSTVANSTEENINFSNAAVRIEGDLSIAIPSIFHTNILNIFTKVECMVEGSLGVDSRTFNVTESAFVASDLRIHFDNSIPFSERLERMLALAQFIKYEFSQRIGKTIEGLGNKCLHDIAACLPRHF